MKGYMVEYGTSERDSMLVDYRRGKCRDCFDLRVSEDQCVYLRLGSGKSAFFETGDYSIRLNRGSSDSGTSQMVDLFWFNLSDQIELQLDDTIQVMEQMLKSVDPELRLFYPVDVRVRTDITVCIEDREKLLSYMYGRKSRDLAPILDKNWLQNILTKRLHDITEETVNRYKSESRLSIVELQELKEAVEVAMISDICAVLDSLGLELVALRTASIVPTRNGIDALRGKEAETLAWYNQVQMDRYCKRSVRESKKKEKAVQAA